MSRPRATLVLLGVLTLSCHSGKHVLNDVHSRLNPAEHEAVFTPRSTQEVVAIVTQAKRDGASISISGGRHAMGGQQFGSGTRHISTVEMQDVLHFDPGEGRVRVEAGLQWPKLIEYLREAQKDTPESWAIVQKPTGADKLSIGGALAANIHGRGLHFKPVVQDVESFTLVNAEGTVLNVSRTENAELFRLAIGGYGLFGVITEVELRLRPRTKLKRVVEVVSLDDLPAKARQRLDSGALYGDFQYKTDPRSDDFMETGVLSTYEPVSMATPIAPTQRRLTADNWNELLMLAHTDKSTAFRKYSEYYLTTNGQIYWSDEHQLGYYNDQYEEYLKKTIPGYEEGSLMISELYVPTGDLVSFMRSVAEDARRDNFDIVYGTLRLICRDDETFLAWAKQDYACVIFNLRVRHTPEGIEKAQRDFRLLIDRALERGGSFYLTYHRWATREQLLHAYPQFVDFLEKKLEYDPEERFQSDWYRHYRHMFEAELRSARTMREGARVPGGPAQ